MTKKSVKFQEKFSGRISRSIKKKVVPPAPPPPNTEKVFTGSVTRTLLIPKSAILALIQSSSLGKGGEIKETQRNDLTAPPSPLSHLPKYLRVLYPNVELRRLPMFVRANNSFHRRLHVKFEEIPFARIFSWLWDRCSQRGIRWEQIQ